MKNINFLIIFVAISVFSCCKKPEIKPTQRDVYTMSKLANVITVWKNGEVFIQREDNTGMSGDMYCFMFVENSDVYTCNDKGEVWKNNQSVLNIDLKTDLNKGASIRGICVSNGDIYSVAVYDLGYQQSSIAVFKNSEILHTIPWYQIGSNVNISYLPTDFIYVNGADVYFAGSESKSGTYTPQSLIVWKNGEVHFGFDGTKYQKICAARGVGEDIYLVANVDILKNRQYLFTVKNSVYSISVDSSDIYLAGIGPSPSRPSANATVWKNGEVLYNNLDVEETKFSYATSVVAIDGDVYVAGYCQTEQVRYICTWKNGELLYKYEGNKDSGSIGLSVK